MSYYSHETAIIDHGARIGDGTRIWHWSHICAGASIGANCTLGQNVFVADNVIIGNNCKIQNNVSIYDGVIIEDQVFCGPSMVFTNVYNPRASVPRRHLLQRTLVRTGASLGANCTLVCGIEIGRFAFVGAGAVVTSDVKQFALVAGVPIKQIGWVNEDGDSLPLPLTGSSKYHCKRTNKIYELQNGNLRVGS